jgi:uncharacterized phage-like protein YoqJ
MKICVTGHRPDAFIVSHYDEEAVKALAESVVEGFKRKYGEKLSFNLGGAVGVDQWMGMAAIDHEVRFSLFLPFPPHIQSRFWKEGQRFELGRQIKCASEIFIADSSGKYDVSKYHERDKSMVDNCDFVLAFWVGRRRGGTFNTIRYALSKPKSVLNALNNLHPVLESDLESGWTPPHIR